jgi:hypothetical protein
MIKILTKLTPDLIHLWTMMKVSIDKYIVEWQVSLMICQADCFGVHCYQSGHGFLQKLISASTSFVQWKPSFIISMIGCLGVGKEHSHERHDEAEG